MEKLKAEIKLLIEVYTEQMESKASVKAYQEASILQIKISELENVLVMINLQSWKR